MQQQNQHSDQATEQKITNPYASSEVMQHEQEYQKKSMGDDLGMRVLLPVGRSGWAIAAGYLGIFSVTIILAPLAIIVSIVAMMDIKKSRNSSKKKHGMGRAVFGLIMGILGSVLLIIWAINGFAI